MEMSRWDGGWKGVVWMGREGVEISTQVDRIQLTNCLHGKREVSKNPSLYIECKYPLKSESIVV